MSISIYTCERCGYEFWANCYSSLCGVCKANPEEVEISMGVKHILAIHKNGKTVVNPKQCPHDLTVTVRCGHFYTIAGEATDSEDSYEQCLRCSWVLRGDRTWGPTLNTETDQIPY